MRWKTGARLSTPWTTCLSPTPSVRSCGGASGGCWQSQLGIGAPPTPHSRPQPPTQARAGYATTADLNLCAYAYCACAASIVASIALLFLHCASGGRSAAFLPCISLEALLALLGTLW